MFLVVFQKCLFSRDRFLSTKVIIKELLKILIFCQEIEYFWAFSRIYVAFLEQKVYYLKSDPEKSRKWSFWKSKI